jgi:hypothetical protein
MNEVMLSGNNYTLVYNALSFGTAVMLVPLCISSRKSIA